MVCRREGAKEELVAIVFVIGWFAIEYSSPGHDRGLMEFNGIISRSIEVSKDQEN